MCHKKGRKKFKGLITLSLVSLAFLIFLMFFLHFSSSFGYQHVGIQNANENARKSREKHAKNQKCEHNAKDFFYITLCVG